MWKKVIIIGLVGLLIACFFYFELGQYLSLEKIKAHKDELLGLYEKSPLLTLGVFFVGYVLVTGASLPGAAIMTLLGGFLFGTWLGTAVVSFASSIGATLAFLVSRYLFRDLVNQKFKTQVTKINNEFEKNGLFYLFTLRLIPAVPFFIINIVMGLTKISARNFYWVSQLGMLPATFVYVNAGGQLGELDSLKGILSPTLIGSFVLLALFPWIAKFALKLFNKKKEV